MDEKELLPYASELNMRDLWMTVRRGSRIEFLSYLRGIVRDPDTIDGVGFCDDCSNPEWEDNLTSAGRGLIVCDSCWDNWAHCGCCNEHYPEDDLHSTVDEESVCGSCRMAHYTWCEECDGYYRDEDVDNHDHDDVDYGGCCDSPQLTFAIRNDGCGPLANDTVVTVTLPGGVISDAGMKAIRNYLYDTLALHLYRDDLTTLGTQWQTKAGNFAKRLSRFAHQKHQVKLGPEVLSKVGSIASAHSQPVDVTIEVTRDLNQSASHFYHEGSCWWTDYSSISRCALKTNGGFGLRSFRKGETTFPNGRAWVMPLRQNLLGELAPTFDTMTPDAFIVFNGYGDLSGYAGGRIMAHMAGWTYRKISFDCSPMYVNAGGYLVAPEEIAERFTDGSLFLSVRQHSSLFDTEQAIKEGE